MTDFDTVNGRGLVGGRADLQAKYGFAPPLAHPLALEVCGPDAAAQRAAAAEFVAGRPLAVEIGFGRGDFMAALCRAEPDTRFLAFEVRTGHCRSLLQRLDAVDATNVRVVRGDVRELLCDLVPPASLAAVYILFPDPWWKARHARRRFLTPTFADALATRLAAGGTVWLKTDVPHNVALFDEAFAAAGLAPVPATRAAHLPRTHREERCHRTGLPVFVSGFASTAEAP